MNSHEGGLNDGLLRSLYQLSTEADVKTEPIAPADRQIVMEAVNFKSFMLFIEESLFLPFLQECPRIFMLHFIPPVRNVNRPAHRFAGKNQD